MCTVSWWRQGGGLQVWFNRDEKLERPDGLPPQMENGLLAPRDPQGGGTWLTVDEDNTFHCVLNFYQDVPKPKVSLRSRGELPLLSARHKHQSLQDWLQPDEFAGFQLLRIPQRGALALGVWDGETLRVSSPDEDLGVLTSSSWNADEVLPFRLRLFNDMVLEAGVSDDRLQAFHFHSDKGLPAFSPNMSRQDARTRSISCLTADDHGGVFKHETLHRDGSNTLHEMSW